jgi:hypothetical protein
MACVQQSRQRGRLTDADRTRPGSWCQHGVAVFFYVISRALRNFPLLVVFGKTILVVIHVIASGVGDYQTRSRAGVDLQCVHVAIVIVVITANGSISIDAIINSIECVSGQEHAIGDWG